MLLAPMAKKAAKKATRPKRPPPFGIRLTEAEEAFYRREADARKLSMAELFKRGAKLYVAQNPVK